jgi:hypothetical protein
LSLAFKFMMVYKVNLLYQLLLFSTALLMVRCGQTTPGINETPESILQAGAASAPVNPEIGSYIAGDKQNRKFTGIQDSLFVKAIVLNDGATSIAIITVDCIGLMYPDIQKIREKASSLVNSINLPPGNIILSSTHTHSGPDVVGIWGADLQSSGVDTAYMDFLVQTAAEQVRLASENLQPVTVLVADQQCGEEWVQNISDKEIDRTLTCFKFINRNGDNIASITNFACHPTYLDAKFSVVSADYVGGFYKEMNSILGGENIFLQGAIGGWVQPVDGEGSFQKANQRGKEIAHAAIQTVNNGDTLADITLKIHNKKVKFLVENEGWKQLAAIGTIQRDIKDSVETEVIWFAVGPAQFITHPGETAPSFALTSKSFMNTTGPKIVIGLGMDALGYILKPEYFENDKIPHAPYLTSMSVGRKTGSHMMEAIREVIP